MERIGGPLGGFCNDTTYIIIFIGSSAALVRDRLRLTLALLPPPVIKGHVNTLFTVVYFVSVRQ